MNEKERQQILDTLDWLIEEVKRLNAALMATAGVRHTTHPKAIAATEMVRDYLKRNHE